MINLLLSIVFFGCIVLIYILYKKVVYLKFDLDEYESKAKFWEKQYKTFSKDEAISKEMILRKKYERLYHKTLDELDKLKDKRQFNGTKHLQRGNNRKTN
jgi:hypothetical protein